MVRAGITSRCSRSVGIGRRIVQDGSNKLHRKNTAVGNGPPTYSDVVLIFYRGRREYFPLSYPHYEVGINEVKRDQEKRIRQHGNMSAGQYLLAPSDRINLNVNRVVTMLMHEVKQFQDTTPKLGTNGSPCL